MFHVSREELRESYSELEDFQLEILGSFSNGKFSFLHQGKLL
jgi:hypothetical protein